MKQDGLSKERAEAWRQGQSLIVVATIERSQNKVGGGQNKVGGGGQKEQGTVTGGGGDNYSEKQQRIKTEGWV